MKAAKASDFRPGNIIMRPTPDGEEMYITPLTLEDIIAIGLNRRAWREAHPLPISEHILESAGFVRILDTLMWRKEPITMARHEYPLDWSVSTGEGNRLVPAPKYVHNLQNFFFALTGEELKIGQW